MARSTWLLLVMIMLWSAVQARDVLVLGIFPDRALIQVDGERRVLRIGESDGDDIRLLATDSRAGHVNLQIDGHPRQVKLGTRAGGSFQPRQSAQVRVYVDSSGAYTTSGAVNGRSVNFLVDTGATSITMSGDEARRLGVDYSRGDLVQVSTASGTAFAYTLRLDRVRVGEIEQRNVQAIVIPGSAPRMALLGMSFLNRLRMRNEGQALVLEQLY